VSTPPECWSWATAWPVGRGRPRTDSTAWSARSNRPIARRSRCSMPTETAAPNDAGVPEDAPNAPAPDWLPASLRARQGEGRLLSDDLVRQLPNLPPDHPLAREWLARADATDRLLAYLGRFEGPLSIVDGGTGNGWLAAAIASLPGTQVA